MVVSYGYLFQQISRPTLISKARRIIQSHLSTISSSPTFLQMEEEVASKLKLGEEQKGKSPKCKKDEGGGGEEAAAPQKFQLKVPKVIQNLEKALIM